MANPFLGGLVSCVQDLEKAEARIEALEEAAREVVATLPLAGTYHSLCAHCHGVYPSHKDNCPWERLRTLLSTTEEDDVTIRAAIRQADPGDTWLTDPGVWRGATRDGERTATMSCPECGEVASLSNHEIAPNGDVSPSVVCPHEGCGFHRYVTLEGWGDG